MRFVRPHDGDSVARLLATLSEAPLNYAEAGATLCGSEPTGFRHHRRKTVLGRGRPAFERAVVGLQEWRAHHMPGVRVFRDTETIRLATHVVVTPGVPVLALAAPCRVVGVVDEPDRWGFAYGTLPGHPEQGEELFVVSVAGDDTVRFEITAFSRPGDALVRLSGPLGRRTQVAATKAYSGPSAVSWARAITCSSETPAPRTAVGNWTGPHRGPAASGAIPCCDPTGHRRPTSRCAGIPLIGGRPGPPPMYWLVVRACGWPP